MSDLVSGVATTIRHFRKAKSVSQERLALDAHLDRTYISGIERGVRNVTLKSLETVIAALDVTLPQFLVQLQKTIKRLQRRPSK